MKRTNFMWLVLLSVLVTPMISFAQVSCTRGGLKRAVDLYIDAQTKGDISSLPLATGVGYLENMAPADINNGLINRPMEITHHRVRRLPR